MKPEYLIKSDNVTSMPGGPALLSERDAAIYLGMSMSYLRKSRRFGEGPEFVRIGSKTIRYRVSDLQVFIDAGTVRCPKLAH